MPKKSFEEKLSDKLGISDVLSEKIIQFLEDTFFKALANGKKAKITGEATKTDEGTSLNFKNEILDEETTQSLSLFEHRSLSE